MRVRRPIWVGIAGVAILLGTSGAALAAPASAGAAATRATATTPAAVAPTIPDPLPTAAPTTGVSASGVSDTFGPEPADIITCTVTVQNPHNSSHVKGTVNTIATIACTGAMSELAQYVGLYFNNVLVGESYNSNSGVASLTGNFATPCKSGTWMGASSYLQVPPAGYYPPYTKGEAVSNIVKITC